MRLILLFLSLIPSSVTVAAQQASSTVSGPANGVDGALLKDTPPLDGKLYHVQGIALNRDTIWDIRRCSEPQGIFASQLLS